MPDSVTILAVSGDSAQVRVTVDGQDYDQSILVHSSDPAAFREQVRSYGANYKAAIKAPEAEAPTLVPSVLATVGSVLEI